MIYNMLQVKLIKPKHKKNKAIRRGPGVKANSKYYVNNKEKQGHNIRK